MARSGQPDMAESEIRKLQQCYDQMKASSDLYWVTQVHIQLLEARACAASARGKTDDAVSVLRNAAAEEDAVEKLPVTPGPIIPAREQLADLLLALNQPKEALTEFEASLSAAPGRRAALIGAAKAADMLGEKAKAEQFRATLR